MTVQTAVYNDGRNKSWPLTRLVTRRALTVQVNSFSELAGLIEYWLDYQQKIDERQLTTIHRRGEFGKADVSSVSPSSTDFALA